MERTVDRPVYTRSSNPAKYLLALGMALALMVLGGLWAYNKTQPESAGVARRDLVAYVRLDGDVIAPPGTSADVFSFYRAPVSTVFTTLGAHVNQGAVLVELSHPSADVYLEQAKQSQQASETGLANTRKQFGAAVSAAQERVRSAREAERTLRGTKTVPEPAGGTEPPSTAKVAGDAQRAYEDRVNAEQDLIDAQAQSVAALLPYQRQLEDARAAVRAAQAGKKEAMIRAPITGTVVALNARAGQMVGDDAQKPIATVVNLDALQVHAKATPEQVAWLAPKTIVQLGFLDIPDMSFDGTVRRITTDVGNAKEQLYVAIVRFKNEEGLVKPAMKSRVVLKIGEAHDALTVPNDALKKSASGGWMVNVLREGKWELATVEIGLSDGKYTEVKSGLNEKDIVQVARGSTS